MQLPYMPGNVHLSHLSGANLDLSAQVPEVKSNKMSAEVDAVLQEPVQDKAFGMKRASEGCGNILVGSHI
jgi:hypothetical protein